MDRPGRPDAREAKGLPGIQELLCRCNAPLTLQLLRDGPEPSVVPRIRAAFFNEWFWSSNKRQFYPHRWEEVRWAWSRQERLLLALRRARKRLARDEKALQQTATSL